MPPRRKWSMKDVPPGVSKYRYAYVDGVLRAFTSDKVRKYVVALDSHVVEPTSRTDAAQRIGVAEVAKADLDPVDLPTAVRVYGSPQNVLIGGVGINGCQYVTVEQLAKLTGMTPGSIRSRRGKPSGSVVIKGVVFPLTSETILWAHGEIGGSSEDPQVIK